MFPLCTVGLLLVFFLLKFRAPPATAAQRLRKVDWTGGGLFIASGTLFLVAISWGGLQFSWSSPWTLVPLFLGVAGLVGTALYEGKVSSRPFLRRSLFWNFSSKVTYLCGALQGFLVSRPLTYIHMELGLSYKVDLRAALLHPFLLPGRQRVRACPYRLGYASGNGHMCT